jgi:hypothetical protein
MVILGCKGWRHIIKIILYHCHKIFTWATKLEEAFKTPPLQSSPDIGATICTHTIYTYIYTHLFTILVLSHTQCPFCFRHSIYIYTHTHTHTHKYSSLFTQRPFCFRYSTISGYSMYISKVKPALSSWESEQPSDVILWYNCFDRYSHHVVICELNMHFEVVSGTDFNVVDTLHRERE